ncbi:MAG: DUF559 domain-containing protein, partial [bacterium]|nr:DUF559 domain-containing protein [bacterium]
FYCIEKKLAIELDGEIHDTQKERDEERDSLLNSPGINILRFPNESVIGNIDAVIKVITEGH